MSTHIVTGATGLVGAALALELLHTTDDQLVCLTRPGDSDAATRLVGALQAAARGYGHADALDKDIEKRCRAVPADLTEPLCGVDPTTLPSGTKEFWHCAADLRYEDHHWDSLRRTNVDGTRHALDLAETLDCAVFDYISTAYVAGGRMGTLLEEPAVLQQTNNRYEDSKILAEGLVLESPLTTRIMRPSIVVGHSATHAVMGGHSGLYGLQSRVANLARLLIRLGSPEDLNRPLRLRADQTTPINLVPVDLVAADAVAVSRSGIGTGIFHLTHPNPLPLGPGVTRMFELAGLPAPVFTDSTDGFTQIDREFDRKIVFFLSYMSGYKVFDQTQLLSAVPDSRLNAWQIDIATIDRFYHWYLGHLAAHR